MQEGKLFFFDLFKPLVSKAEGFSAAENWIVTRADVDPAAGTMAVSLECPIPPDGALLSKAEKALAETYGLIKVTLRPAEEPTPEINSYSEATAEPFPERNESVTAVQIADTAAKAAENPAREPPDLSSRDLPSDDPFARTEAIRREALKQLRMNPSPADQKKSGKGTHLFGGKVNPRHIVPMETLNLDMGEVTVEGDVFFVEHRELKKRKAWVVCFEITDYTGSIRITKFMPGDDGKPIVDGVKMGQRLIVRGKLTINRFDGDMVLEPGAIAVGEKPKRTDDAHKKRVELHLHTNMSAMDALCDQKRR
jgi:DNA polymerase-3 subunit alpha (Gram-positive type)